MQKYINLQKKSKKDIMKLDAQTMHRMCLRKAKYKTQKYAEEKAKQFTEQFGVEQYAYFCPLCGYYHLTTKSR